MFFTKKEGEKKLPIWEYLLNSLIILSLIVVAAVYAWARMSSHEDVSKRFDDKYGDDRYGLYLDRMRYDFDSTTRQNIIGYIEAKEQTMYDTIINGTMVVVTMEPDFKIVPAKNVGRTKGLTY